jgi:protein phosphatase
LLRAFGLTDKGRIRPINEDCFAVHEGLGLCVVADGMGGHNAGEVAAQLAVDAVVAAVGDPDTSWPFGYDPSLSADGNLLRTAVYVASARVLEASGSSEAYTGMGTTMVAARVACGRLAVAHAGDSRLYLFSGGRLSQVTKDDSWLVSMLDGNPDADIAALQRHPMRGALTNVIGAAARTTVHVAEHPLAGGEMLLLSTDGVHGVLDAVRLERMMRAAAEPQTIARRMIDAALACGSRDNCTAVVAEYRPS